MEKMKRVPGYLACTIVLLTWACGRTATENSDSRRPAPDALAAGVLEGSVLLVGQHTLPPTRIENTTDPEVCGGVQGLEDLVVSESGGRVQNVILFLTDVPDEKFAAPAPTRITLDNRGCRFVPHVAVLTIGGEIEAANSDPILHSAHFYGALKANLALPFKGSRHVLRVDRPGMVIVKCDVHGWMQAFIRVDRHPFHAVSDANGGFRISQVPPGTYTLEAWHERLGTRQQEVSIESEKVTSVEITYRLEEKDL